jgi:hypothetical protein
MNGSFTVFFTAFFTEDIIPQSLMRTFCHGKTPFSNTQHTMLLILYTFSHIISNIFKKKLFSTG